MIGNVFFYLSGIHPILPEAEVKAILEAEGFKYGEKMSFPQLLRLETDPKSLRRVGERAGMTHVCCREMFTCGANIDVIKEAFEESPVFPDLKGTFEVRVRRVMGGSPQIQTQELERVLGALVERRYPGLKVRLEKADFSFFGILSSDEFAFGLVEARISPKGFEERRPSKRPFFHPAAAHPRLARCMVNLARPKAGDLLLDPFCGSGGLLIEAELIGCKTIGSDIDRRMIGGYRENMIHYKLSPKGIAVADARKPPLLRADSVATDAPFGRSTKTFGATTGEIVTDFLSNVGDMLQRGSYICISAPDDVGLTQIGIGLGLRHVETYLVFVHKTLTREICVFER